MSVEVNNMKNAERTPSKVAQGSVKIKSFYNKHFPTDRRTYNLRLPFVGLILSIVSLHFVASFAIDSYLFRSGNNTLLLYCYIFVAAAVAFELYYGLKIGDRKQYTPWIILKVLEVCGTTIGFIFSAVNHGSRFWPALIYGIIVIILNFILTYVVTYKSIKQFRGKSLKDVTDDNIYDDYDNV